MKTIGIYPGTFQPPHKGHYTAYKKLRQIAGPDTFVVTTDFDPSIEAPLHFGDKEQILARHGVPSSHIRQVRDLFHPKEVLDNFDPETTVVIYAFNKPIADKLINKSSYYKNIDWAGGKFQPFKSQAYVLIIDDSRIGDKTYTSKNVREALGSHRFTHEQKEKWFKHFFGWFDLGLFELLKNKYTNAQQSDAFTPPTVNIKEELTKEVVKILNELLGLSGTDSESDPTTTATTSDMEQSDVEKRREANQQKQDLIKQKQKSERDLKSIETDLKWKKNSVLSLRKDQLPNKRKEIDTLNQQISQTSTNPPSAL